MSDPFWAWLNTGLENGWCSEMYCDTHEGIPMDDEELAARLNGDDVCMIGVRILGTESV